MHGIFESRFRDNLLAFRAEYRLPVWWRFGLAAFTATGQVDFHHARLSGGVALRVVISQPSRLNLRVDLGASAEGSKLHITFNETNRVKYRSKSNI
jgi:hypothetical protein